MKIYYENHIGEQINLVEWPYMAQTGSILDYTWNYGTGTYGSITNFTKAVQEKELTITVSGKSKEEFKEALEYFHEAAEKDIYARQCGKLYVNDTYLRCFIFATEKTEWEADGTSLDMKIKLVTDYPFWIKEDTHEFPSNYYLDFEEFAQAGYTNEEYISVAEKGSLNITIIRENGSVDGYSVSVPPLRSLEDYADILCKNEVWGINKAVELMKVNLSGFEKIVRGRYTTWKKQLPQKARGTYKSNTLDNGAYKNINTVPVDEQSGYEVISSLTERANVTMTISGNDAGVSSFRIYSIKGTDKELIRNKYMYLEQYKCGDLEEYTLQELENGIDRFEVQINLNTPLGAEGKIYKVDGVWYQTNVENAMELSAELQDVLNHIPTYDGITTIYTDAGNLLLECTFNTEDYYNNILNETTLEFLQFPSVEFVYMEEDVIYIRTMKNNRLPDCKILYVVEEPIFTPVSEETQLVLSGLDNIEDIRKILVTDSAIEETDNEWNGKYPHGYPYGYAENSVSGEIINNSIAGAKFKLYIYGKCTDPSVTINGNIYKVLDTLSKGEFILIDSASKTITKYNATGETFNLFNKRYKEHSIFKDIPDGKSEVAWDKTFGFDLVLINERGEPAWT